MKKRIKYSVAGTMTGRVSSGKSVFKMLKIRMPVDFTAIVKQLNERVGTEQFKISTNGATYIFENTLRAGDAFATENTAEMRECITDRLNKTPFDPFNL